MEMKVIIGFVEVYGNKICLDASKITGFREISGDHGEECFQRPPNYSTGPITMILMSDEHACCFVRGEYETITKKYQEALQSAFHQAMQIQRQQQSGLLVPR